MFEHQKNPPMEPVDEVDTTLAYIDLADVKLPAGAAPLSISSKFPRV